MNILLVDDDVGIRRAIGQTLRCAGWFIREAHGGYEAVRMLCRHPLPDAILTDLYMPDGDGFELLRHTRVYRPDVRVIVMSGGGKMGSLDLLPAARELGAAAVLRKPIRRTVLLETLHHVCNGGAATEDQAQASVRPEIMDYTPVRSNGAEHRRLTGNSRRAPKSTDCRYPAG